MAKVTFFVSDGWYTVGNIAEWGDQAVTLSPGTHTLEISGELIVRAIFRDNFVQSARWTYYELLPVQNLPDGTTITPVPIPVDKTGQSFRISINEGYEYEVYGGAGSPQSTTTTLYLDFAQYNTCSYEASASGAFEKLAVRIPNDTPTKAGYVFLGWSDVQYLEHKPSNSAVIVPGTGQIIHYPPYDPILDATDVACRPGDEFIVNRMVKITASHIIGGYVYPHVGAVFAPRGNMTAHLFHDSKMRTVTPFVFKDGKWQLYLFAVGFSGIFERTKLSGITSGALGQGRLGLMQLGVDARPRLDTPRICLVVDDTPEDDTKKLDAPVITLVTEHEKLSTPVVRLEAIVEQLLTPVIELKEV